MGLNKYDLDGNEIWSTPIQFGTDINVSSCVGKAKQIFFYNNEIRVMNEIYSDDPQGNRIGATCINQSGDVLWTNTFDVYEPTPAENESLYAVDCTMDDAGNLYAIGQYNGGGDTKGGSFGDEYQGVYSISIDNDGNLAWRIAIPVEEGSNHLESVMVLEQNGQVMIVCQNSMFDGNTESIYGRLSTDGSSLWTQHRGSNSLMEQLFAHGTTFSSIRYTKR